MNCQDCRKHLHPYLDNELEVPQNLEILEHLNACGSCRAMFDAEEASWGRVRQVIGAERAPDELRAGLPRALATADRRETWRRTLGYVIPVGVAAAFVIYMMPGRDDPVVAKVPHGPVHEHGPAIHFTVSHFLGLKHEKDVTLLSKPFLDRHGEFTELCAEDARRTYRELMGPGSEIPSALRGKRIRGAVTETSLNGTPVQSLLLSDHRQQLFGLYVLKRSEAGLDDMHDLGSKGVRDDIRLERCRGCSVIAVLREEKVYIFVAHDRSGVESAIEMARETF